MNRRQLLFAALAIFPPAAALGGAAAPPRPREPVKAVVASGTLLTCARGESGYSVQAWVTPLGQDQPAAKLDVSLSNVLPPRWQVGHGAFWVAAAWHLLQDVSSAREGLDRYELGDLLNGKVVAAPRAKEGKIDDAFSYPSAADLARMACRAANFDWVLHSDILPAGPYEARQFVLRNVRGKVTPRGKTDLLSGYSVEVALEDRDRPHWSLTVHRCKSEWDRGRGRWRRGSWAEEESLPVAFREQFQVLARGEDYYFVTRSGRLFAAPKPPRGERRKVELVWADPARRVEALLTDADSGRSYLFCRARPGEKPSYFELGEKPRPVGYDPAKVKAPAAGEPLRTLLLCARVLAAEGKLKHPLGK